MRLLCTCSSCNRNEWRGRKTRVLFDVVIVIPSLLPSSRCFSLLVVSSSPWTSLFLPLSQKLLRGKYCVQSRVKQTDTDSILSLLLYGRQTRRKVKCQNLFFSLLPLGYYFILFCSLSLSLPVMTQPQPETSSWETWRDLRHMKDRVKDTYFHVSRTRRREKDYYFGSLFWDWTFFDTLIIREGRRRRQRDEEKREKKNESMHLPGKEWSKVSYSTSFLASCLLPCLFILSPSLLKKNSNTLVSRQDCCLSEEGTTRIGS